jgi:rhomboid family GlyGly-CTERM serine protease
MKSSGSDRCAVSPRTGPFIAGRTWIGQVAARPATATIAALALMLNCPGVAGHARDWLVLSRDALAAGAWWTIFTAPLLHLSGPHLLFDVLGLLFVGWMFEPPLRGRYVWIALSITLVVSATFLIAYPQLDSYYGLSSLDQGLFCAGLAALWRRGERVSAGLLLAALAAKWIAELGGGESVLGRLPFDEDAFGTAVPWTHIGGGLAGLFAGYFAARFAPRRAQDVT